METISGALTGHGETTVTTRVPVVLGEGDSWAEALDDVAWTSGDVLVVGTSSRPLADELTQYDSVEWSRQRM